MQSYELFPAIRSFHFPAIFLPTPKTVAMMYGVKKINEMNVNANTSATQLYKDITTIIHNYATEKVEKNK